MEVSQEALEPADLLGKSAIPTQPWEGRCNLQKSICTQVLNLSHAFGSTIGEPNRLHGSSQLPTGFSEKHASLTGMYGAGIYCADEPDA